VVGPENGSRGDLDKAIATLHRLTRGDAPDVVLKSLRKVICIERYGQLVLALYYHISGCSGYVLFRCVAATRNVFW
jgi:hypothetical protein